jgi:hypothetical protein
MRIFEYYIYCREPYEAKEDGYIIAKDRTEAEEKLEVKKKEYSNYRVCLNDSITGKNGIEISENGIAVRWFQ